MTHLHKLLGLNLNSNWPGSKLFFFFWLRKLSILIHTKGDREEGFKETISGVYPKGPNSWIHSTSFKFLEN